MKCKRCGGDFPHKRGTYCGECEPDPRPAGETALTDEQVARIIGEVEARVGMGHGAWDMVKPGELVEGFRAALIADAPVVWVTRDGDGALYADGDLLPDGFDVLTLRDLPPGACVRYRLVPDPEEPHD